MIANHCNRLMRGAEEFARPPRRTVALGGRTGGPKRFCLAFDDEKIGQPISVLPARSSAVWLLAPDAGPLKVSRGPWHCGDRAFLAKEFVGDPVTQREVGEVLDHRSDIVVGADVTTAGAEEDKRPFRTLVK